MTAADTQCSAILRHLKSGRSITPLEALMEYRCLRLAARVLDLRRDGHLIDREMVHDETTGKHYASYRLAKRRAA